MIKSKKATDILFSFIIAVLFLFVCSKNSPFYPMNDWSDADCLFTVGKVLHSGAVMYKDVFDHKGPLLYLIFYIATWISDTTFIGVLFFEIISITGFLFFCIQIARLFVKNDKFIYVVLPFLALGVLVSSSFTQGGSAEEFALFPLAYSLFYFLSISKGLPQRNIKHVLLGVSIAFVFWTKFTMLGFYIGAYVYLIVESVMYKDKGVLKVIGLNILGFLSVSLVIIAYFLWNNALIDMLEVYFYNNIFIYTQATFVERVVGILVRTVKGILKNYTFTIMIFVGFLWMIAKKQKDFFIVIISFLTTLLGAFYGKGYVYYPFVMAPYAIFVIIPMYECYIVHLKSRMGRMPFQMLLAFSIGVSFIMCFFLSPNTYMLKMNKTDMPQFKFAEIINAKENPTLLNYRSLDGGFYFTTGIVPQNKYFYGSNMDIPEIKEEQDSMIGDEKIDFVITSGKRLEEYLDNKNYQLVMEDDYYRNSIKYTYYLYEKIN